MNWDDISDWVTGYQRKSEETPEEKRKRQIDESARSWGDPNTGLPDESGVEEANDPSDVYFAGKSLARAPASVIMKTTKDTLLSRMKKDGPPDINKKKKENAFRETLSPEEKQAFNALAQKERDAAVADFERRQQEALNQKMRDYQKAKGEAYKPTARERLPESEIIHMTDGEGKQDPLTDPIYRILSTKNKPTK